jgi:lipopolysaccharide export system permease protein
MIQRNGYANIFTDSINANYNVTPDKYKNNNINKRKIQSTSSQSYIPVPDSIKNKVIHPDGYFLLDSLILDQKVYIQNQILSSANSTVNNLNLQIKTREKTLANKSKILNRVELELHKKYAIGISCIVLFFVGAPLGAIIRKGGLGLPLVVSILLFLGYHFFGIFAGNSAESGGLSPIAGAWIATLIMLPLGIYLTYRATTDQGFINTDLITDPFKKLFKKLKLFKTEDNDN